jgi:hypothetical protein
MVSAAVSAPCVPNRREKALAVACAERQSTARRLSAMLRPEGR